MIRKVISLFMIGAFLCSSETVFASASIHTSDEPLRFIEEEPEMLAFADAETRLIRQKQFLEDSPLASEKEKMLYLLSAIESSGLTFIRNGSEYTSQNAMRWILWKSQHRKFKKRPIRSAEDFIKRCATRSNTSGLFYEFMNADGKREKVGEALHNELKELETFVQAKRVEKSLSDQTGAVENQLQEKLQTSVVLVPTPTP